MPANKEFNKRCSVINAALQNGAQKSTNDLKLAVQKMTGKVVTDRTIRNDIAAMKSGAINDKKAPIKQTAGKRKKWYYSRENFDLSSNLNLTKEEFKDLQIASQTLSNFQNHGLLKKFSNAINKVIEAVNVNIEFEGTHLLTKVIFTDDPPYSTGSESLPQIVEAIQNGSSIRFVYKKFGETTEAIKYLFPLIVKEYKGRWYVIGEADESTIKTYGLDRIKSLEVLSQSIRQKKTNFNSLKYFRYSMGVTVTESPPIKIQFETKGKTTGYIETMPLHHTQKIVHKSPSIVIFEITVIPTYELFSCILSYGKDIKVVSPNSIKNELKKIVQEMLNFY